MFSTTTRSAARTPTLARFKSSPAPYRPEKIPVQLYRDFEGVGVAGEIVRVKPAFMRNTLHRNNGAGYLLKGQTPKIPVVEKRSKTIPVVEPVKEAVKEAVKAPEAKSPAAAMSLGELSSLFGSMSRKRAQIKKVDQKFATSETPFSIAELKEMFPVKYTVSISAYPLPIGPAQLAKILYEYTGTEVPVSLLKITNTLDVKLAEIDAVGEYKWVISNGTEKPYVVGLNVVV